MNTALILFVVVPILFAAAVAVRHLVRSILVEGLPDKRSALDTAYAQRLLRESPGYPLLPDDTAVGLPDLRWQRLA
jgi:hypothetical protein